VIGVLAAHAWALRELHQPGRPLLLPNAWDAGSARLVAAAGLPAVATSSAAVAEALGYADGEAIPVDEVFAALDRVARSVPVPVTADIERGYRLPPAELVERLATAGIAGCNLEDSDPASRELVEPERQADFLAAVRAAATGAGVPLVVNARVDVYVRRGGGVDEAVARGRRYLAAGADCVYPILAPPADIGALVEGLDGPVNILFRPDGPDLAALAALGVARISYGSGLYQYVQEVLRAELARITGAR